MTRLPKGRSIELFYIDGDPEGMVTAAIPFQWTGHVLVINRTQLKEALDRPETSRPGIYLLTGEVDGEQQLYIGETDDIRTRIKQHESLKDWWSSAICITSSGDPLNKAHARYLESRLISDARRLRKIKLDNGTSPPSPPLSEAALAHMEDFLDNIFLVLPALRFDFFIGQAEPSPLGSAASADESVCFTMEVPRHGVRARARLENGKFIVEKGSIARSEWAGTTSAQSTYGLLFNDLVDQGVLVRQGDHCVYAKSYAFKSPSAAAAVTAGRPASGPGTWTLDGTTKTYGEWEKELLGANTEQYS